MLKYWWKKSWWQDDEREQWARRVSRQVITHLVDGHVSRLLAPELLRVDVLVIRNALSLCAHHARLDACASRPSGGRGRLHDAAALAGVRRLGVAVHEAVEEVRERVERQVGRSADALREQELLGVQRHRGVEVREQRHLRQSISATRRLGSRCGQLTTSHRHVSSAPAHRGSRLRAS
jgi:hypothetical protein